MAGSRRLPRWVKVTTGTLVILTILFYVSGGLVFANMIHSDLLIPEGPTPDKGIYLLAIDDNSVTLTAKEEREDIVRPGLAGLAWDHGYGLIGDISEIDGLNVTRAFDLASGTRPRPCSGPLDTCDEIDIESFTYQTDPGDVGLAFEDVSFQSSLGDLGAWRVDSGDGSLWVIHAHGWRVSRREALRSLTTYHRSGVTSLIIDYRNDEEAPPDPSGIYHFGRTEWEDVEGAVEYALDQGAEHVILHGYSTGAALHLSFLEHSDLASEVIGAVYDSPNADTGAAVRLEATKRNIPGTPIPVPRSLTNVAMLIADIRWDVHWNEIDYIERAGDIVTIPTLVFHGHKDERVPIEVARRLRDAAPESVRLIENEDAGHVTSWNVDPKAYEANLESFVSELMDLS